MLGTSDQVATFLNIVVPWTTGAYVNIHAFVFEDGKLRPRGSRAARDLNEATSFCRWADSQGLEVYACMSSQRQPGTGKADRLGRTNYRALRGEMNAVEVKSFFIDVDVKELAYGSTQEAVEAVQRFCGEVGLPPPSLVVYSGGGGFHAHWVLDKAVTPTVWKPIAAKLADACRQKGLKADTQVSVDVVRILRVPGTTNRKYDSGRPVALQIISGASVAFATLEAALEPFSAVAANIPGQNLGTRSAQISLDPTLFPGGPGLDAGMPSHNKFLAGLELSDPSLDEVAAGCPFVAEALHIGGAGYPEPLWFASGHIALFTADGREGFHRLSNGYRGYSQQEVDEKFSYLAQSQQQTDRGWPRCATIELAGSKQCAGCGHKADNRSPLNFAVRHQAAPPVTPTSNSPVAALVANSGPSLPGRLPIDVDGFIQHPVTGLVYLPGSEDEGQIEVWGYPIWNLEYRTDTNEAQHGVHFDTRFDYTRWRHVVVPTSALVDLRGFAKIITGDNGLALKTGQTTGLLNFMNTFIEQLRSKKTTAAVQETLGWSLDPTGQPAAFIYGSTRFNCSGNTPFFQTDQIIKKIWTPAGSADAWKAAVAMVNAEQRPAMDLLIATAFAAPLMRFTGQSGVVISGYSSGSGVHKTTGLRIGQATWGSAEGINQLSDTLNSVMEKIGKTKVLPVYYDEMKASTDIEKFSNMVFTLSGGRGKGRLGRNAEIRDVGTWDTLLVGASNDSLISHIIEHDRSTEAGVNRVFEFEVSAPDPKVGQVSMGEAGKILTAIKDNYGHAGLAYAEHLGRSVATLPKRVTDVINVFESAMGATQDERFWVAAMAVLQVGAQMANDLNLTRFDVGRMADFMLNSIKRLRVMRAGGDMDVSKGTSLISILSAYVNSNRRSIVVTDTIHAGVGRRGLAQTVRVINPEEARMAQRLAVHIAENDNVMRVSKAHFMDWLKERKLPAGVVVPNIMKAYSAKEVVTRIGVGTDYTTTKERLIEFDCTHPELNTLLSN